MTDAATIEQHKENIQPLAGGRPASKLASGLKRGRDISLVREREQLERNLHNVEELDDPLQCYVDYISWLHNNYPQGTNSESGLVLLLERCTSYFRDYDHYKNDARYLRIWLEYANFSDAPKDIFVYLAKKAIGNQLALYYEEFANYLESVGNVQDAALIYDLGIERNARPIVRLRRSYANFKERTTLRPVDEPPRRNALTMRHGDTILPVQPLESTLKRQKLSVYHDTEESPSVLESIFQPGDNYELGGVKFRMKENTLALKLWAGEVLPQKKLSSSSLGSSAKFAVYRDVPEPVPPLRRISVDDRTGKVVTHVCNPGKREERIHANVDLLYQAEEEYCSLELLIMARREFPTQADMMEERQVEKRNNAANNGPIASLGRELNEGVEHGNGKGNVAIPTVQKDIPTINEHRDIQNKDMQNDDSADNLLGRSHPGYRPSSPTVTMFSRMANQEVVNMFNDAAAELNSDDEHEIPVRDNDTTNYDGFVTETMHARPPQRRAVTPPTDIEDHSSPFLEEPSYTEPKLIDLSDANIRTELLRNLSRPLSVYPGYHGLHENDAAKAHIFREITHGRTRAIPRGSQAAIIDFCGDEMYFLRQELGLGDQGTVYLVEASATGDLMALKIELPSSEWEFYIMNQIQRRLFGQETARYFVRPMALFAFRDESYLFMEYYSQGTILDVIHHYQNVDELLTMLLTIELLKSIETLHSTDILHGDIKPENCMLRFEAVDELPEVYNSKDYRWAKKSLTLIDFGRSVDTTLFADNVQFVGCQESMGRYPQDVERPWCYEMDYYNVANVVYSMLFGTGIRTKVVGTQIFVDAPMKPYWQVDMWESLFHTLLNPYDTALVGAKRPIIGELRTHRLQFERWLSSTSKARNFRDIVLRLEHDVSRRIS